MSNPYKLNLAKHSTHSLIKRLIGANNTVLDVGCNEGYLGSISDPSNVFYGLEYSADSIQVALKNGYRQVLQVDLNKIENLVLDTKFEVIVFADVLEHLLHPELVLEYFILHHLQAGGRIIVSLPNIANWQIRIQLLLGIFDYTETGIMDKTHLHFYTYKSARELLLKDNLKIKSELAGSSFFGPLTQLMPFTRPLLATSIIYELQN